ncbi:hypothetical protein ACFV2U_39995, partial [Streptomyces sp. NPDC059697]|uniref:hypothetical protein n=1 Tax=Streptomyces sp. NPDC059697 TaxID=3346912 RepID=UPI0036B0F1F1
PPTQMPFTAPALTAGADVLARLHISRLPDALRAQRGHRNLMARHGRRWVRNAYPDARKIYFAWLEQTADPFDLLDTAQRRAVATGHVTWLVEQVTARNVLLGYVPKDRKDPLIQWIERYFSIHKFAAFHRSRRIYDAFFPRETIPPSRHHEEVSTETRWSPFLSYYRC